jgi:hypothetical protein
VRGSFGGRRRGRIAGSRCWGLARWWRGSRIGSGERDVVGQCVGDGFLVFVMNEVRDGDHDVAEEADVFRLEATGIFAVAVVDSNDGDGGLTGFAGEGRGDVVVLVVDAASGEDREEGEEQEGAPI